MSEVANKNARGNAATRRRRRQWLLDTFGDGIIAPCTLGISDKCLEYVNFKTLSIDRITPGCEGGTYVRGNIRPACGACNSRLGGILGRRRYLERRDKPKGKR